MLPARNALLSRLGPRARSSAPSASRYKPEYAPKKKPSRVASPVSAARSAGTSSLALPVCATPTAHSGGRRQFLTGVDSARLPWPRAYGLRRMRGSRTSSATVARMP